MKLATVFFAVLALGSGTAVGQGQARRAPEKSIIIQISVWDVTDAMVTYAGSRISKVGERMTVSRIETNPSLAKLAKDGSARSVFDAIFHSYNGLPASASIGAGADGSGS